MSLVAYYVVMVNVGERGDGMETKPRLVRAGEVARLFHASPKTVARWAAEGKIPVARITLGGHREFDLNVLEPIAAALWSNGGES